MWRNEGEELNLCILKIYNFPYLKKTKKKKAHNNNLNNSTKITLQFDQVCKNLKTYLLEGSNM
jgi:hypothetical protein